MASSNTTYHYPLPSAINALNFVSTKLWFKHPNTNYKLWEEQMRCLIECHDLLGFIDGSIQPPPPETPQEHRVSWRKSDRLLKGWILVSLDETLASQLVQDVTLRTARDVWWELETQFYELTQTQRLEQITSANKLWFTDTNTNYEIWKEQIRCLIDSQGLIGFIDDSILRPQPETQREDYLLWRRSDRIGKAWILSSLDEPLVSEVEAMTTARDLWLGLEDKFSQFQLRCQNISSATSTEQINEVQEIDLMEYVPLHKAVLQGNWEVAKRIFDRDPMAISAGFDSFNLTPLQVAVGTGKTTHFVQKMVDMMPDHVIAQTSYQGQTALHLAATVGNVEAAIILVRRMTSLLYVSYSEDPYIVFPIQSAAIYAQRKMVEYLISVTKEQTPYNGMAGLTLLISLIRAEYFDIALDVVIKHPHLVKLRYPDNFCALSALAEKKTIMQGGSYFGFWERFIPTRPTMLEKKMMVKRQAHILAKYMCKQMESMNFMEASEMSHYAIINAALYGNSYLVEMVIEAYPKAIYSLSSYGGTIFQVAVENRSESVFNLIYQMSSHKHHCVNSVDYEGNTLLHAAGTLGPSHKLSQISGAALQLQRELQWYKAVENLVLPEFKNRTNKYAETPRMLFTRAHRGLKEEGEKWMKETSASCTIATALIATVMFAAAITVPGGTESATGFPVFSKDITFVVFGISTAVSLFTSTTSLLIFLSILTSRYAEEDFLHALPKRLIMGLGSLFLSVTFMMVAFSVTIYLVFGQKKAWVLIPVAALACLPVTSFVLLQYPLLADLISSTYGQGIFGKQSNRPFY